MLFLCRFNENEFRCYENTPKSVRFFSVIFVLTVTHFAHFNIWVIIGFESRRWWRVLYGYLLLAVIWTCNSNISKTCIFWQCRRCVGNEKKTQFFMQTDDMRGLECSHATKFAWKFKVFSIIHIFHHSKIDFFLTEKISSQKYICSCKLRVITKYFRRKKSIHRKIPVRKLIPFYIKEDPIFMIKETCAKVFLV